MHPGGDHLVLVLLEPLEEAGLLLRIPRKAVSGVLATRLHIIDFVNHPLQSNVTELDVIIDWALSWGFVFFQIPAASDVTMVPWKPHLLDVFRCLVLLL